MSSANKVDKMKHNPLETRVALVEQSIGHINETLVRLENKIDRIELKIGSMDEKMDGRIMYLDKKMDERITSLDSRLWTNFYWILGTMFALSTLICGVLAKGFHWLG